MTELSSQNIKFISVIPAAFVKSREVRRFNILVKRMSMKGVIINQDYFQTPLENDTNIELSQPLNIDIGKLVNTMNTSRLKRFFLYLLECKCILSEHHDALEKLFYSDEFNKWTMRKLKNDPVFKKIDLLNFDTIGEMRVAVGLSTKTIMETTEGFKKAKILIANPNADDPTLVLETSTLRDLIKSHVNSNFLSPKAISKRSALAFLNSKATMETSNVNFELENSVLKSLNSTDIGI